MAQQYLRPDADVSIGGWTKQDGSTTSLFDALNESSPDDNDYIISSPDPVADIYRFRISDPTAILEDGTFRYRFKKIGSGTVNVTARLIQGHTTWNPFDLVNLVLSNGNLTATDTLTSDLSVTRSVASETIGLKYAELILDTVSDQVFVGMANATFSSNDYLGVDLNGIGWIDDGEVIINGAVVATVATYAPGDTLGIAVNFDSEKIWFRVNGDGWNDDVIGNQNPATNTGGISFSSLNAGPYFIAMALAHGLTPPAGAITANFGATAYDQTPPSGFTDFGGEATIAEWEHTDITTSFVDGEQTLTTPQFESITDFDDLYGELEANSGVAAYDPSTDAGLVAWYKADDVVVGGAEPADLDNITAIGWDDSSGNGYDMAAFGAAGTIIYRTNQLNGLPGIQQTTTKRLRTATDVVPLNSTTLSVILVLKHFTGAPVNGRFFNVVGQGRTDDWNNSSSFVIQQTGGTTPEFSVYSQAYLGSGAAVALPFNTAVSIATVFDGTLAHVYKGGVEQGSGTSFTNALGGGVCEHIGIWGYVTDDTDTSLADFYEIIVTTTNLAPVMSTVTAYINAKWGVS